MQTIKVNITIYGSLSKRFGRRYLAAMDLALPAGTTKADLLAQLGIHPDERGYLFIDAVLHEVPGFFTEDSEPLTDGAHIGIFSADYMWPYQYRDGIVMSDALQRALAQRGAMHHTYKEVK